LVCNDEKNESLGLVLMTEEVQGLKKQFSDHTILIDMVVTGLGSICPQKEEWVPSLATSLRTPCLFTRWMPKTQNLWHLTIGCQM